MWVCVRSIRGTLQSMKYNITMRGECDWHGACSQRTVTLSNWPKSASNRWGIRSTLPHTWQLISFIRAEWVTKICETLPRSQRESRAIGNYSHQVQLSVRASDDFSGFHRPAVENVSQIFPPPACEAISQCRNSFKICRNSGAIILICALLVHVANVESAVGDALKFKRFRDERLCLQMRF